MRIEILLPPLVILITHTHVRTYSYSLLFHAFRLLIFHSFCPPRLLLSGQQMEFDITVDRWEDRAKRIESVKEIQPPECS